MAEVKALSPSSKVVVDTVIALQKKAGIVVHWDSDAHRAGMAELALAQAAAYDEAYKAANDADKAKFGSKRAFLAAAFASEPWDYASNMKKRLVAVGLLEANEEKAGSIYG